MRVSLKVILPVVAILSIPVPTTTGGSNWKLPPPLLETLASRVSVPVPAILIFPALLMPLIPSTVPTVVLLLPIFRNTPPELLLTATVPVSMRIGLFAVPTPLTASNRTEPLTVTGTDPL